MQLASIISVIDDLPVHDPEHGLDVTLLGILGRKVISEAVFPHVYGHDDVRFEALIWCGLDLAILG